MRLNRHTTLDCPSAMSPSLSLPTTRTRPPASSSSPFVSFYNRGVAVKIFDPASFRNEVSFISELRDAYIGRRRRKLAETLLPE